MALIIKDPKNFLPEQIATAKEQILIFQSFDVKFLNDVAYFSGDKYFNITSKTSQNEHFLLNGQTRPEIEIQPNEWQRWRIIYAGW